MSARRVTAVCVLALVGMLVAVSGAEAVEPMNVSLTVVNQRGINQFSYIKLAGSGWFSNVTDGNGQFSAEAFGCLYQGKPCIRPGDRIYFSRDEGQTGLCAAPEDPAGLEYVVTSSPTQMVTLPNTTGESAHTSLTSTESWIVGKLNQDRASHTPPLPPLHVSSTLNLAAYAIAHDRALAPTHPYPPPYCYVNLSDWGWPVAGFLHEDSGYATPEATLAHWDGTAGDPESINLAKYGVYNAANTAVGVADGGGTWIIEFNNCAGVPLAFVARCGMTSETGDPTAYTPPTTGGGGTTGGTTGGATTGGATTGGGTAGSGTLGTSATGGGVLSIGGGLLALAGNASASSTAATSGGISVMLNCTGATGKTCTGRVSVFVREQTRSGNLVGVLSVASGGKMHVSKVLVGLAKYTVEAGKIKTVAVSLNRTGRSLLKRFRRIKVIVRVSVTTPRGMTELATRTVTVRAAAVTRRGRK